MLEKRLLGKGGPSIGCLGYGAMVLEGYYGGSDDDQAVQTLRHAIDLGMMIDTADGYGNGHNEELVKSAIRDRRDRAFIATKFGIVFDEGETATELPTNFGFSLPVNGKPEYVHKALERSLDRLGVDEIDLWYLHFPDPSIPIEETVGAMAEAVQGGKVRYLGLSNVTAAQVEQAQRVHPISAVQYEYSLWRREAETELLPTLRRLGIALVAWSPLGAGFLAGPPEKLDAGDFRHNIPRFSSDNLASNRDRFAPLLVLAKELGISPAQLALAWLLHQGEDIVPIPGTRSSDHIDENAQSSEIILTLETLERINKLARPGLAKGGTLL